MIEKSEIIVNFVEGQKLFFLRCYSMSLSVKTIKSYECLLNLFKQYLDSKNITNLELITKEDMQEYLVYLSQRIRKVSVRDYYITINAFFNYLLKSGYLTANPLKDVKKPKPAKRIIRTFTPQEVKSILSVWDKNEFLGFRNYTMMSLLFSTGIRKQELLNICNEDLYLETNMVKIIGKGDKQRNIPLTPLLREILVKYLKVRMAYIDEHSYNNPRYMFISHTGRRLKASGVNSIFSKVKSACGITGERVSSHTFRHTFAKFFLLNGGDVFTLQRLMGHEDISTTKKYISLNDNDLRVQNDKYNPLENDRWRYF
jgi:site-specific recombinase XerD